MCIIFDHVLLYLNSQGLINLARFSKIVFDIIINNKELLERVYSPLVGFMQVLALKRDSNSITEFRSDL